MKVWMPLTPRLHHKTHENHFIDFRGFILLLLRMKQKIILKNNY